MTARQSAPEIIEVDREPWPVRMDEPIGPARSGGKRVPVPPLPKTFDTAVLDINQPAMPAGGRRRPGELIKKTRRQQELGAGEAMEDADAASAAPA